MQRHFSPARLALTACVVAALTSCGGGGPDAPAGAASVGRERALSLPPGTTVTAEAATKGMFGPLRSWPLIAVHGVLTSDGRVLSCRRFHRKRSKG